MTAITTDRIRKSVKLSAEDYRSFVKWVDNQPTKVDAAILLDITRPTLDRILGYRSGSPGNIEKVLNVLRQDGSETATR
jgi:hypothetical protein